jgi:hypothetical protein
VRDAQLIQPPRQAPQVGGLTGPFDSLEDDEEAGPTLTRSIRHRGA